MIRKQANGQCGSNEESEHTHQLLSPDGRINLLAGSTVEDVGSTAVVKGGAVSITLSGEE